MAIIIEEEKRKINWFNLAVGVFIVVLLAVAVYYLFFISPPLIEKVAPVRLQSLEELSSIKLEPEAILNNPNFQILKQYANPIEINEGLVGKVNPFAK
jgi:hypothetical protein